jgi:hypothetical protein
VISRLISRLRHRQFGVLVTASPPMPPLAKVAVAGA